MVIFRLLMPYRYYLGQVEALAQLDHPAQLDLLGLTEVLPVLRVLLVHQGDHPDQLALKDLLGLTALLVRRGTRLLTMSLASMHSA
jgi:hypothetical protein